MGTLHSVTVDLPPELYERIRQVAAQHDRPFEAVLVESLAVLFGTQPANLDAIASVLDHYSDAQLWAVVYQRLTWAESSRLRELIAQSKQSPLTPEQEAELDALQDRADQVVVLRSRALALLQQRGRLGAISPP